MSTTRRRFLLESGALVATAVASRGFAAPAVLKSEARRVQQLLPGMPTMDGAGVQLTRVIGQPALRHLDPFILLDRFHSEDPNAYVRGFPDHPHRGFETVTVMLDGNMRHRDSRGNHGLITGGGSQWMTAGRGIVHSEMPEQEKGLMSGFQLWVNLPAKEKMCPQYYQDLKPSQLVEAKLSSYGSKARIISGHLNGLAGPVRTRPTNPTLMTVALEDDRPLEVDTPDGQNAFVFVSSGEIDVGPDGATTAVREGMLALLAPGQKIRARATAQRSEFLVAAGKPLNEPIVQRGPFVMNTEEEIQKAWSDYRAGILDKA